MTLVQSITPDNWELAVYIPVQNQNALCNIYNTAICLNIICTRNQIKAMLGDILMKLWIVFHFFITLLNNY